MNDLTILFYSANLASDYFIGQVVFRLLETIGTDVPIISVTHKPMKLGHNLCLPDLPVSAWSVYYQILQGAKLARTPWVACAEDDTLYPAEHFLVRPDNPCTFWYNKSRWILDPDPIFRYRDRTTMCACIASRDLMVSTLETRFAKYPTPITDREELRPWGEPGRYERNLGLPPVPLHYFRTDVPCITFNHKPSLRGIRRKNETDVLRSELEYWGDAKELWDRVHG